MAKTTEIANYLANITPRKRPLPSQQIQTSKSRRLIITKPFPTARPEPIITKGQSPVSTKLETSSIRTIIAKLSRHPIRSESTVVNNITYSFTVTTGSKTIGHIRQTIFMISAAKVNTKEIAIAQPRMTGKSMSINICPRPPAIKPNNQPARGKAQQARFKSGASSEK